jgi:hypothetical protein
MRKPFGRHVRDHAGPAAVAQLVEQRTFNPTVVGSSPTGGIEKELVEEFWILTALPVETAPTESVARRLDQP